MYKLVSEADQKRADQRAVEQFQYPSVLLMEQASAALATRVAPMVDDRVVVLAGTGNNGGDAWGVARYLHLSGKSVHVVTWGPPRTDEAIAFARAGQSLGIPTSDWASEDAWNALRTTSLWLDGLMGAGFRPPLRPSHEGGWKLLLELRQTLAPTVVAIDVPSGLSSLSEPGEDVLRADLTLATGWGKLSCFRPGARAFCGRIEVLPLGYPEPPVACAEGLDPEDLPKLMPPVPVGAHKGTRGRVLLIGGSEGMTGALILAAQSTAAAGAGLVGLWTDANLVTLVASQVPSFQVRAPQTEWEERPPQACVVGPGWGRRAARSPLLARVLDWGLPTVIDADGLWAWSELKQGGYRPKAPERLVLTPHPGEMRTLLGGLDPTFERAQAWAEAEGTTLVLKDAVTWIFSPGQLPCVWDGQNPALGTGGSGDCLAGILGALLGRGAPPSVAARAGVLLHGQAGAQLAQERGWFTADELPPAIARWGWQAGQI